MKTTFALSLLLAGSTLLAQSRHHPVLSRSGRRGPHTETVQFPEQSFWNRLFRKQETVTVSVPAISCLSGPPSIYELDVRSDEGVEKHFYVVLDVWGYPGTISKKAIHKLKNRGMDITALPGRTVIVNWGCP